MSQDEVSVAIRLRNAQKFAADSARSALALHGIGDAADDASRSARAMGGAFSSAANVGGRAFGALASQAKFLGIGLGAVGAAGVAMGLKFNAQVESARLRFGLFTNDVEGLTKAVQAIDLKSQFNFGDLSDAAALFGNNGVQNIPKVLQGAANAAAASGKGTEGFKSIAIALSQIAAKGRLSQEEINQLNEAGAPGAQRIIAEHFKLTAKELQNLGGQGLDAQEAIKALTDEWTSGKMAKAAEEQTKTLGGQWALLTGNIQKLTGAATAGLASELEHGVLPAANRAVEAITEIFGREGLTNEQKLAQAREVIRRELGPVWQGIKQDIDQADIPGKLGDAVAAATPRILDAMGDIAPKAAKAFVDGWLHSGPEAQLITALFLGNKLRKSDFGQALFSKGGKAGQVASSVLGARGATPKNPLWVAVVNGDTVPGKGVPTAVKDAAKTATGAVAARAAVAARFAGAAGAGDLALSAAPLAGILALAKYGADHNFNYATKGPGSNAAGYIPGGGAAPGFGGGTPGALNINLNVDGKTVSRVTATSDQIEQGRLAAAQAARR
jgi:tape measure domain-containing protein